MVCIVQWWISSLKCTEAGLCKIRQKVPCSSMKTDITTARGVQLIPFQASSTCCGPPPSSYAVNRCVSTSQTACALQKLCCTHRSASFQTQKLARPDVVLVLFLYPLSIHCARSRGLINHLAAESKGLHCMCCCSFLT